MRPPKRPQGPAETPLNQMLGRETSVRVLRELSRRDIPVSTRWITAFTRLDRHNVRLVLRRLVSLGVAERVGRGTSQGYQLRASHPLAAVLQYLFREERSVAIRQRLAAQHERLVAAHGSRPRRCTRGQAVRPPGLS